MSSFAEGLFVGLAFFVVLPEAWAQAWPLVLAGLFFMWLVDRYLYPLCEHCGGAGPWPLWITLGVHSFLDGAVLEMAEASTLAWWALALHRIPETAAIYGVLRETRGVWTLMILFQVLTLLGYQSAGLVDSAFWRHGYALAAGAVVFMGWHGLHEHWEEKRLRWAPAGLGLLAMGAVRQFGHFSPIF
jgi:zinc transporter ZupT